MDPLHPAIFIGDDFKDGALNTQQLKSAIEEALQK
jgi:hypothetical protein